jgi:hypothetical protein
MITKAKLVPTVFEREARPCQLTGNTDLLDLPLTLHSSQHLNRLQDLFISFTSDVSLLLGLETARNGVIFVVFRAGWQSSPGVASRWGDVRVEFRVVYV